MQHPDCQALTTAPVTTTAERQPPTWGDLTETQQTKARPRAAHLLEPETGYRSGRPSPGRAGRAPRGEVAARVGGIAASARKYGKPSSPSARRPSIAPG